MVLERSKLGAELFREYGGSSVVIRFLESWILLVLPGGPTEDKPEIHFQIPEDTQIVSHSYTIRVDNCQETYEMLLARGVDFITPPPSYLTERSAELLNHRPVGLVLLAGSIILLLLTPSDKEPYHKK